MSKSLKALERLCKVKIYQKEASAYDYLGKEIYKEEINTIKQELERLEEYDETLKTRCGNCYYRGEKSCTITKSPLSIETLIKCIEADRFRATNAFHKVLEEKDLLEQVWNKEEWCKGIPLSAESLKSLFNYNEELFNKNLELDKENLKLKQDIISFEDYSYDLDCEKQQLEKENLELKEELDTFKLAFYTLWKCCNSDNIPSDIDSDFYLEFKCGYESLCIPVTEQEIESIEKACELLDMEVKEVLEDKGDN